jgi:hypothetical protein
MFFNVSENISRIYQFILSNAYIKYPTCRYTSRYNRKIKNYYVETNYGKYPDEDKFNTAQEDDTSYSTNNFLYSRLSEIINLKKTNLNKYNTSIDINTNTYLTRKMLGLQTNMFFFNEEIIDDYKFGYENEVQSRALLGFSFDKIKKKFDNQKIDSFTICIENGISPNYVDNFTTYNIYTYYEGAIDYNFDEHGNPILNNDNNNNI